MTTKIRTILKFDTGADGFMKMIRVLIFMSIVVLLCGSYFLLSTFTEIHP